jgi:hypothetical protein
MLALVPAFMPLKLARIDAVAQDKLDAAYWQQPTGLPVNQPC